MADGKNSGLAHGTSGSPQMTIENTEVQNRTQQNEEKIKSPVSLPPNNGQIKHIFRNAPGHLADTPQNRAMLLNLANDASKYIGTDSNGNSWNAEIMPDGSQNWVRYRNGTIINGGNGYPPRQWDSESGLNSNPKKNNTWRKKSEY